MKTLKMEMKSILKSKIKDFIFNRTRVKAVIFWFEKNEVLLRNKDDIIFFYQKLLNFRIKKI